VAWRRGLIKPEKKKLDAVKEPPSVPSDYERISCAKRFFSGAGTERLEGI
jgi:hypothetical protein